MSGQDIRSLYQEELIQVVREMGGRDFQGKQLFRWLHQKQVGSYQEMTDLPKAVRSQLEEGYPLASLYPADTQVSALDGTRKFLFALADGQMVESVWMHYRHGDSVCISSQAGCRMGCRFCASTIGGLIRWDVPWESLCPTWWSWGPESRWIITTSSCGLSGSSAMSRGCT